MRLEQDAIVRSVPENMKKLACLLTMFFVLQMGLISSNEVELSTSDPIVTINQGYIFHQELNPITLSVEDIPSSLSLEAKINDLPETRENNVTFVLLTNNDTLYDFTYLLNYESSQFYLNSSIRERQGALSASINGNRSAILHYSTFFLEKIPIFDPLDISIEGEHYTSCSKKPTILMNPSGIVHFTIRLTVTKELEELSGLLDFDGYAPKVSWSSNTTGFQSEGLLFWLSQVKPGRYSVDCDFVFNLRNTVYPWTRILIKAKSSEQPSLQISCNINGNPVSIARQEIRCFYERKFLLRNTTDPGFYYSDSSLWRVRFSTALPVILTIDRSKRENIEYLNLGGEVEDFSIKKEELFGQPCYRIDFFGTFSKPSEIGLQILQKEWLLVPGQTLAEMPPTIVREYTDPSTAFKGHLIDVEAPIVGEWAKEVVGDINDPLRIAYLLYMNLTHSIKYNKSIIEIEEQLGHEVSASWILGNKIGLCRHLARAYAALLMYSGLPTRIVLGTVISAENEEEPFRTSIPNHVWNEVFLPGSGWVTVDPTGKQFGILDSNHMAATFWQYSKAKSEFSELNTTTLREGRRQGKDTLEDMIQILRARIEQHPDLIDDQSLGWYQNQLTLIVSQVNRGQYHEALLNLAELANSIEHEMANTNYTIPNLGETLLILFVLGFASLYLLERKKRG